MALLRNLFHHTFHCLCHLFVTRASAHASMLCPLLLDPLHPVITGRYKLMLEQPVALPGLPRAQQEQPSAASDVADEDAHRPMVDSVIDHVTKRRARASAKKR